LLQSTFPLQIKPSREDVGSRRLRNFPTSHPNSSIATISPTIKIRSGIRVRSVRANQPLFALSTTSDPPYSFSPPRGFSRLAAQWRLDQWRANVAVTDEI
jgi:hypothetical protein